MKDNIQRLLESVGAEEMVVLGWNEADETLTLVTTEALDNNRLLKILMTAGLTIVSSEDDTLLN